MGLQKSEAAFKVLRQLFQPGLLDLNRLLMQHLYTPIVNGEQQLLAMFDSTTTGLQTSFAEIIENAVADNRMVTTSLDTPTAQANGHQGKKVKTGSVDSSGS